MKLAPLRNGTHHRWLVAVSRGLQRALDASSVAPTLQHVLDEWDAIALSLMRLAERVEQGESIAFDPQ